MFVSSAHPLLSTHHTVAKGFHVHPATSSTAVHPRGPCSVEGALVALGLADAAQDKKHQEK